MIWLLILLSSCYTFPCESVTKISLLDQDNSFNLKSLSKLITCLLDDVEILEGELLVNHFWELDSLLS